MDQLTVEPHPLGIVIAVKAAANSKKMGIRGIHAGNLRVGIAEPAEKGKANQGIIKLLAKQWKLKTAKVEIISGQSSPHKRVLLKGVSKEQFEKFLVLGTQESTQS